MSGLLEGKSAVVAVGGWGIGREVSLAFARHGAMLLVNDTGTESNGTGAAISLQQDVLHQCVYIQALADSMPDKGGALLPP